jgi:4-phosphopantoate--beta-alanine ligase
MGTIPKTHPRYRSLTERHLIEEGFRNGITHVQGLIAQGRGEAFDYLLGERTRPFAKKAAKAAAAMLLLAEKPVISVNGNVAALCPDEVRGLCRLLGCTVEVNLFYRSSERVRKIVKHLRKHSIEALGSKAGARIPSIKSARRLVEKEGIHSADVVLVMLEDGDRTEMLKKAGKKAVAIDLNPLSRTAGKADITVVDNVIRALPCITAEVRKLKKARRKRLQGIVRKFDNRKNLSKAVGFIRGKA